MKLTNNGRFEIDEDSPGHVLSVTRLAEEGAEGVVAPIHALVGGHGTIGGDAVLQAVQLPAGVAHLDTGLSDVDGDALSL